MVEGVPEPLGRRITEEIAVPTIGIGASPACDGQVLVTEDILGLFGEFQPKFVKRYAELAPAGRRGRETLRGGSARPRSFPSADFCFGAARPA